MLPEPELVKRTGYNPVETRVFRRTLSKDAPGKFGRIVLIIFLIIIAGLFLLPWQQSAFGTGRVVAKAPIERQQGIEAPVSGRVIQWNVSEGDIVRKGDPIVDISDNDPDYLKRLEEERRAALSGLSASRVQAASVEAKLTAVQSSVRSSVAEAENKVSIAQEKLRSAERSLDEAVAEYGTAKINLQRQRQLAQQGLVSTRALELAELKYRTALAGREKAKAGVTAAKNQVEAAKNTLEKTKFSGQADISSARATYAKAQSEVAKSGKIVPKIESRLSRQRSQKVYAPRGGTVMRILKPDGQQVSQGDILAVIVPDTSEKAVELFISGNDIPLIREGKHVRLQFQGWPAIQASGWPGLAIGTFGGTVKLVDVTDDGTGFFRVLVFPDTYSQPWPSAKYLRQGVRAKGWIFLNEVSLGYEIWRRFNDFPPVLPMDEPPLKESLNQGLNNGTKPGKGKK